MKKILLFSIAALLLLVSCLPSSLEKVTTLGISSPTASPSDRSVYEDGLIAEYQSVLQDLSHASLYDIKFNISEDLYHVTGTETVIFTNAEEIDLNEIKFRLFPNILGGEMHVDEVIVNGDVIIPNYSLNDSLLTIPLKLPLQPGEYISVSMSFEITVAQSVDLNYGVQAYYDKVLTLAHAYPLIAVYDDEGWNTEIPPQSGDLTYADMAFFIVTVEAPKDIVLVGSGVEINRENSGGRQTVKYEAGPVRDFYLAASPDYIILEKEVNGTDINFYTRSQFREGGEYSLDIAARALEIFNHRYAPYPYTELDIVSTPTLAFGIEYPGVIAIADRIISPENRNLEATIVHEVGHQWFYNLVGNDQLDDPWLDESLTQFITLQYFTDEYGPAGKDGFGSSLEERWGLIGKKNIPIGLPVRDYTSEEYRAIVYGRGALFFDALRNKIGTEKFDLFIKEYVQANSWGIGTTENFKTLAEQNCSCDLTALFIEWVYP